MRHTDFLVRFTTVDRRDRVVAQERSFASAEARTRFLDKLDDTGRLVEVLATSDAQ